MTNQDCPVCNGFGWIPENHSEGWYQRDWRLMLDPTVAWMRCPDCGGGGTELLRLQERLAEVLLQRIASEAGPWLRRGPWFCGNLEGNPVWRQEAVAVLPPGPAAGPEWMMVSALGVMRGLGREQCAHHLGQIGLTLPADI